MGIMNINEYRNNHFSIFRLSSNTETTWRFVELSLNIKIYLVVAILHFTSTEKGGVWSQESSGSDLQSLVILMCWLKFFKSKSKKANEQRLPIQRVKWYWRDTEWRQWWIPFIETGKQFISAPVFFFFSNLISTSDRHN